jgi:hypothetical protein
MPQRMQAEISASLDTSLPACLQSSFQPLQATLNHHHRSTTESVETSTKRVVKTVKDGNEETTELIQSHNLESRHEMNSLQVKLEQINFVILSIQRSLQRLPLLQQNAVTEHCDADLQKAIRSILQSIWSLVSGLQQLTRAIL